MDRSLFLSKFATESQARAIEQLLDGCAEGGLVETWWTAGAAIKVVTSDMKALISIAWLFDDRPRWYGLRYFTLGIDSFSLNLRPSIRNIADVYFDAMSRIPGAMPIKSKTIQGCMFSFNAVEQHTDIMLATMLELSVKDRAASS